MKRIIFCVFLVLFTQFLAGCGVKQIQTVNTYDMPLIERIKSEEKVIIRPIADKFLNDQAQNIVIKNNIFTHAYGQQFINILKDSFSKNGYSPIITGNILKSDKDIESVIIEGKNNNIKYAVIAHINLNKFDIKDHTSSNIGKSLIPIAGAFVDKSATMLMSINIRMIMYDISKEKFVINKEYTEESSTDYKYTNSNIAEQIIITRSDMYAGLVNNAISKFWTDFSAE